jgi:hypothetical protein
MSQTDTYPTAADTRARRSPVLELTVLIAVPKVQASRVRPPEPTLTHERLRRSTPRRHQPRRRLRRNVRLAGWSLLALLPIFGGGALGWACLATRAVNLPAWAVLAEAGARTRDGGLSRIGSSRSVVVPAVVAIGATSLAVPSTEPAIGAPIADAEVSVIFPGYLLPDDSLEEAANEGG